MIVINYSLDKLKEIQETEQMRFKKTIKEKKSLLKELEELELDLIKIYDRLDDIDKTIKMIEGNKNDNC